MGTETAVPTKEKYMGTELTTHTFGDITLRGFMDDKDNPFFVAADVANALDYRDAPNMVRILAEDEIAGTRLVSSRSENGVEQDREMTIITDEVRGQPGILHDVRVRGVTLQTPRY